MRNNEILNKILVGLRGLSDSASLAGDQQRRIMSKIKSRIFNSRKISFLGLKVSLKLLKIAALSVLVAVTVILTPLLKDKIFKGYENEKEGEGASYSEMKRRIYDSIMNSYAVQAAVSATTGPKDANMDNYFKGYNLGYLIDEDVTITKGPYKEEPVGRWGKEVFFEPNNYDLRVISYFDINHSDGDKKIQYTTKSHGDIQIITYESSDEIYEYRGGDYIAHIEKTEEEKKLSRFQMATKPILQDDGLEDKCFRNGEYITNDREIKITEVEDGYIAIVEETTDPCSPDEIKKIIKKIYEFFLDSNGSIISYRTYANKLKWENMINETRVNWSKREKVSKEEVNSKVSIQELFPEEKKIKDFKSDFGNYNPYIWLDGYNKEELTRKVADQFKLKIPISTNRRFKVSEIDPSWGFYTYELDTKEYERDPRFYSSEQMFEVFKSSFEYGSENYNNEIFYIPMLYTSLGYNSASPFLLFVYGNFEDDEIIHKWPHMYVKQYRLTEKIYPKFGSEKYECRGYHIEYTLGMPSDEFICDFGSNKVVFQPLPSGLSYTKLKKEILSGRFKVIDFSKEEDIKYFIDLFDSANTKALNFMKKLNNQ